MISLLIVIKPLELVPVRELDQAPNREARLSVPLRWGRAVSETSGHEEVAYCRLCTEARENQKKFKLGARV